MPWFPELPASRPEPTWPQDSFQLVPFYRGLVELSQAALLASWAGSPRLEDPRYGLVQGVDAFAAYVQDTREWLALSDATVRPVSVTSTVLRSVEEVVLDPEVGGTRQELGVAVVAEWDREHRLTAVRVYHSLPLVAGERAHLPLAPVEATQNVPDFVSEHLRRRNGDLDTLLATYEEDASVQVFGERVELTSGREELRRMYGVPPLPGAGPQTTRCTVTDDGRTCAVEHRVSRAGVTEPVEVGIALYERGPHGRVQRERRYRVAATSTFAPVTAEGAAGGYLDADLDRRVGSCAAAGSVGGR